MQRATVTGTSLAVPLAVRIGAVAVGALIASSASATTTVSDPAGDAGGGPDILSISAGFSSTTLFLSATFAPGTLDPNNLGFNFGLDTDLDPGTGWACPPNAFPCGAEWEMHYDSLTAVGTARLDDFTSFFATIPVTFGPNSFSMEVPLNADPNIGLPDDGEVLFGLVTGNPDPSTGEFGGDDFAWDAADEGPLAGPSTPVPEPDVGLLLGFGIALLGRPGRR